MLNGRTWRGVTVCAVAAALGFVAVPKPVRKEPAPAPVEATARCEGLVGVAPDAGAFGRKVPSVPLPGQAKPPCYAEMDEREIGGACWQATSRKPPCGALYEHEDGCFRVVYRPERQPTSIQR